MDRPGEVGPDRLVNALAAARLYGTPGGRRRPRHGHHVRLRRPPTARTSAARSRPGSSSGPRGARRRTAKLPRVELRAPGPRHRPRHREAIQSGTVLGYQALVDGLLTRIRRELADPADVRPESVTTILTGGLSAAPGRPARRHRRDRPGPDPARASRSCTPRSAAASSSSSACRDAARIQRPPVASRAGSSAWASPGSIAAYKAVELLRLLRAEGADVVVMLTPSAARFVGPLTFAALSRHPVETDVLDLLPDGRIGHIVVADSADAIVVAPATAHWLAAMASGLGGDAVTAAVPRDIGAGRRRAGDGRRHVDAPGDGRQRRPAARRFGYTVVEPEAGSLASGQSGVGRLAELPRIVDAVVAAVGDRPVRAAGPGRATAAGRRRRARPTSRAATSS